MREQDIRNREVHNKYLELVRLDSERIFRDKSGFASIDCPACAGKNQLFQFHKAGFSYVQCGDCETLFVSPRPTYSNLMEIYKDSPSTTFWVNDFFLPMAEVRREKVFRPRAEYIAQRFPNLKTGKVGDIGAGFGIFLEELRAILPQAEAIAIEPSVDMANICRRKGLAVIESMLEDVDPAEHKFDLLTSFELFEHLHHPSFFLERVYRLLKPGGYFFLTTLNGLGFDIQVFWADSKSVSPPHHLNFFNPHSIALLLKKVGFEIIEISTPGELDWDIVEGAYLHEGADPGRFFKTVSKHGSDEAKRELQAWIKSYNFSSHMRVTARK
jgi:SAM-dependent methyltransferase